MSWALLAIGFYLVYLGSAFGARTVLQLRATGDSGFRGISGRVLSLEWFAGVAFVVALVCGVAGPVAALWGLSSVGGVGLRWVGLVVAVLGIALTLVAQGQMGTSWRIGVSESERTDLVTTGSFAWARNPIFTFMVMTGLGLALMTPNVVSLVGFVLLVVAIELQVRVVEEPYLLATHPGYATYAGSVGRFVPGVGRLRVSLGV